ncbi:peroxisome biogenesis factor 10 [Episyrphus balteatus]|uniref:peroxisome biogenesis factor 10 n=1 Tax=Episyrphus balteatus TaxID=286459 RepID=UPI0024857090|nr:peroxisome biogenesis factor 10 [Episyrphus balteatus]
MSLRKAKSRQPETIRTVQKDLTYTNELTEDLSDILRMSGPRNWIKYNNVCKLIAEIVYHGFATCNNLQTLGEEYTGILQIDCNYINAPSKILRLSAIILEFGGETLYTKVLNNLERNIDSNEDILPEAKEKLKILIHYMRNSVSYVKALHKTLFYLNSNKYQISKRITGINYVLIRHWMQPDHSLYGYRILGWITLLQLVITFVVGSFEAWKESQRKSTGRNSSSQKLERLLGTQKSRDAPQCILCLEPRINTSLTPCGHIFCWHCILEWLDERDECPLCRENINKSNVIQLRNFV